MAAENDAGPLPTAQRNSAGGMSLLEALSYDQGGQPHPGETLFQLESIKDLVVKGVIPTRMATLISRMLWKAHRYNVPALLDLIEWYLRTQLGVDGRARDDYKEVVMNMRKGGEEDEMV